MWSLIIHDAITTYFIFQVKSTIEEQLYDILRTQDISSDDEGSLTVEDLKNLVSRRR